MAAVGTVRGRPATENDWAATTIEEEPYAFAKRKGEELVWSVTKGKPCKTADGCFAPFQLLISLD